MTGEIPAFAGMTVEGCGDDGGMGMADALALVTEWKPFCYPDIHAMKKLMRCYIILDGRNQYDPKHIQDAGFHYYGVGRGRETLIPKSNGVSCPKEPQLACENQ